MEDFGKTWVPTMNLRIFKQKTKHGYCVSLQQQFKTWHEPTCEIMLEPEYEWRNIKFVSDSE